MKIEQPQAPLSTTLDQTGASGWQMPDGKAWIDTIQGGTPWMKDGTPEYTWVWSNPMASETETITDVKPGDYTVTITDKNGCVLEKTVTVDGPTGMDALSNAEIAIYPNPSNGQFNMRISEKYKGSDLSIYSVNGQVVHTQMLNSNVNSVDVSELKSGMYIVKVQGEKSTFQQKILIK
jgi:hypothetical protein